jgi:hypothetical protein
MSVLSFAVTPDLMAVSSGPFGAVLVFSSFLPQPIIAAARIKLTATSKILLGNLILLFLLFEQI